MGAARPPLFKASAAALALLCALQLLALAFAPAAWLPSAIRISLAPGTSMILGGASLAAPRAAEAHLRVRRDAAGDWMLSAVDGASPVAVFHGGRETRTGSIALGAGARFAIGGASFDVTAAGDGKLDLASSGVRWRYDGAVLYRENRALSPCPGTPWPARLVALLNRVAPAPLQVERPLQLGGNLHCGNRLGIAFASPGSASVRRDGGGFVLFTSGRDALPVMLGAQADQPLARQELPLAGASAVAIGPTRYAVSAKAGQLVLKPSGPVSLYPDTSGTQPAGVQWTWQARDAWHLPGGTVWAVPALLLLAAVGGAAFAFQRGRWPFEPGTRGRERGAAAVALLVTVGGVTALAMQKAGAPSGVGISMLLGWAALWCWLLLPVRLSLAAATGALLLGVGLLAQLELGLGAPDSSWLRYFQKTAALSAAGLGAGALVVLRRRAAPAVPSQVRVEWSLALLAMAAIGALALQVLFGDETGVFELQPVEFAKLALVALSAHCLAVGMGWHGAPADAAHPAVRWLRIAFPVLVFAALLGVALVQVDDYSPLILLAAWGAAMALAYALATGRHGVAAAIACAGIAAFAAVGFARTLAPADAWSFYGDRFLVWLDPLSHPHTGQQLLRGAEAIAQGAWFGADHLFGVASLGQGAGDALRIPAVQDDFAPAFFLYRHGLAGALVLWLLQSAFLAGLVGTAARSFAAGRASRDFRHAWQYRFRCFALCGGAAFVLGHLALSWGTNLAIVPVMGQPMSFLSAGGSHLLFFICPLLVLAVSSSQPFEEIESCRSMSSTKSLAT